MTDDLSVASVSCFGVQNCRIHMSLRSRRGVVPTPACPEGIYIYEKLFNVGRLPAQLPFLYRNRCVCQRNVAASAAPIPCLLLSRVYRKLFVVSKESVCGGVVMAVNKYTLCVVCSNCLEFHSFFCDEFHSSLVEFLLMARYGYSKK